jgi:hypothetical protein
MIGVGRKVQDRENLEVELGLDLLHDGIVRKYGYERLYARYRSQYTFNPTVEFECPAVAEPPRMLLRDTPIQPDDNIQLVGWNRFRAFSIRDALDQLGEPLQDDP